MHTAVTIFSLRSARCKKESVYEKYSGIIDVFVKSLFLVPQGCIIYREMSLRIIATLESIAFNIITQINWK